MPTATFSTAAAPEPDNEPTWDALYPLLRSFVSYLVRTFPVASWRGQEADIVEDIVQDTLRKVLERVHKAERGEAEPIRSLKQLSTTVAYNCYRDLRRRDRKLLRMDSAAEQHTPLPWREYGVQLLDAVTEQVYQEKLFSVLAQEIARFPTRQRLALLIDLANRMHFGTQATPLQKAFQDAGIELDHYQQPLPLDTRERNRHISILSHAYKRVAHLDPVQPYVRFIS